MRIADGLCRQPLKLRGYGLRPRCISRSALQRPVLPGGPCPPVGRLGLTSPLSTVLWATTTACRPSRRTSLGAGAAIPRQFPLFVSRSRPRLRTVRWPVGTPAPAPGAFLSPRPPLGGLLTRRQQALSSSRVTPLPPCLALRPRWCRRTLALTVSALLPSAVWSASAFRPRCAAGPLSHCPRVYTFRGSITRPGGLFPRASHTPSRECTPGFLRTGWLGVSPVGLTRVSGGNVP